jgi:deoxyribonuclease-4
MKLNLGYCISYPINYKVEIPDYSVENTQIITNLSKKLNCIQIMFSKPKISKEEIITLKNLIKNYKYVFVHASYLINMGAELIPTQTDLYNTGIDVLLDELVLADKINAKGIILHMGKNVKKKYDNDEIYNNMIKFIIELFKKIKSKIIKTPILLETPAGQGGEMCYNLEEFVEFIQRFKNLYFYDKLNICIDTCHIFQAGYDINSKSVIKKVHNLLEPIKNKIKLIHLNDSYHSVGQKFDRHESLGKGHIQIDKLIKFIHPYIKIPMILETAPPYENQIDILNKKSN